MEQTWRWFGPSDPITLADIRQTGATGIVTALHEVPNGQAWTAEAIADRKKLIEAAGLTWSVVESVPVHEDIKRGGRRRDHWIEAYQQSLRNLAANGIDVVCYNFMPILDWTRTDLRYVLPDGGWALRFDQDAFAAFDLFILARAGAEAEYDDDATARAREYYDALPEKGRDLLAANIIAGLPVICTQGPAHEPDVIACIEAGKPVFCEKPLAPTANACLNIMAAEQKAGRKLVTVGFMRRFDASYREMKKILDDGGIGQALMVHCAHRNPTVPEAYTRDMAINDTAIHEIDTMRWLLGEEFVSARVDKPRKTSKRLGNLQDPLVLVLSTTSGVRVDDEVLVNCQYGYDIRCELVAELGTVSLGDQEKVVRADVVGRHNHIVMDHNERFGAAFVTEVQEWITAAVQGQHTGSTSWDGYAAACVCDAAVKALTDDGVVPVEMTDKPSRYA